MQQPTIDASRWQFTSGPVNQIMTTAADRRESQRFSTNAPLTVFLGDREIPAYTRDLSNRGVYFYLGLSDSLLIDRDFEFVVELPPEITLSTCCSIRCRGRLVRKENAPMDLTGVAAQILNYSILREAPAIA
jgi:PilZ domain